MMENEDPFDQLLGLEDTYYAEGFSLGQADGMQAGRIEGRIFGLEKGFEKFLQMGRLHGRSVVWASRLASSRGPDAGDTKEDRSESFMPVENKSSSDASVTISDENLAMPPLPENTRLGKQVRTLFALTEPESLSLQNNEEDVSEFDDRFKRAVSKAVIVGKLVGETSGVSGSNRLQSSGQKEEAGIEDVNILHARH